jgi:hypothetical protein
VKLEDLRNHAINNSFGNPTTLGRAINRMGFVQADPIRSPARAQDLILRQRVKYYSMDDLELKYPKLDVEEDIVYAYGFVSRPVWELLYPRHRKPQFPNEEEVHEAVREIGVTHPKTLAEELDAKTVRNNWGGSSKQTTRALESLHRRGLVRVAKREKGIRLYEDARSITDEMPAEERYDELLMIAAEIFAPAPESNFKTTMAPVRKALFGKKSPPTNLDPLVKSGRLRRETIDGITYIWPEKRLNKKEVPRTVRILAPFDPVVWDRGRFEHFWEWGYKFEAYVPPAKRIRGYYAMPLLWGDQVVGWANIDSKGGEINVEIGYAGKRPNDKSFKVELEFELDRIRQFLFSQ